MFLIAVYYMQAMWEELAGQVIGYSKKNLKIHTDTPKG